MMVKNRIFYYDFLRAFAIIAVVMCHMGSFFGSFDTTPKLIFYNTFHGIGLMGVPIFLMLTGALLLNKKYDLGYFFKKRFLRIVPPFIFWLILIMLFGFFILKWDINFAIKIFMGEGSIMWYFWTLIGIYLFIPVINSFIREYNMKGVEYFLIIWFITIILKTFHFWPVFPPFEFNFNFELNHFTDFMGFVILGYYLANKDFKLKDIYMLLISALITVISLAVYVYLTLNHINMGPVYQNLTNVFLAVGMFLLVKYVDKLNLFDKIQNKLIGNAIVSLSICSYGVYFAHFIVYKYFKYLDIVHSNKFIPVMLMIVLGISWLIVFIISKIPYVNKVCGA